jgi:hypothetical protein
MTKQCGSLSVQNAFVANKRKHEEKNYERTKEIP